VANVILLAYPMVNLKRRRCIQCHKKNIQENPTHNLCEVQKEGDSKT
jgi:hypothetical protein